MVVVGGGINVFGLTADRGNVGGRMGREVLERLALVRRDCRNSSGIDCMANMKESPEMPTRGWLMVWSWGREGTVELVLLGLGGSDGGPGCTGKAEFTCPRVLRASKMNCSPHRQSSSDGLTRLTILHNRLW